MGGNQPDQAADAGSAGAIAIGSITYLTIGFAQQWLAWHDRRRDALEAHRHNRQVFWTAFAALAATVAAVAAVIGGAWTMLHKIGPGDRISMEVERYFEQINAAIVASE
jgi:hypothetical protein